MFGATGDSTIEGATGMQPRRTQVVTFASGFAMLVTALTFAGDDPSKEPPLNSGPEIGRSGGIFNSIHVTGPHAGKTEALIQRLIGYQDRLPGVLLFVRASDASVDQLVKNLDSAAVK